MWWCGVRIYQKGVCMYLFVSLSTVYISTVSSPAESRLAKADS